MMLPCRVPFSKRQPADTGHDAHDVSEFQVLEGLEADAHPKTQEVAKHRCMMLIMFASVGEAIEDISS